MALPTCECVAGLPIGEQLAAIYCATYTLAAGDVDGPYLLKAANLSDVADPEASRVNLGADVGGIWPASLGGTGQSSYAVGDLLYASGAAALSKLADVATGNALISGGVGVAPSWGKIGLTTHVDGVLPVANGGTNFTVAPKVIAYPSGNQALTSGGTTDTVAFGTEVVDTAGAFASNTFTVPASQGGFYLITLSSLYLQGGASTSGVKVSVAINGTDVRRIYQQPLDGAFQYGLGGAILVELAAGDALTITISQADGAAWTILGGISTLGALTIHRVI